MPIEIEPLLKRFSTLYPDHAAAPDKPPQVDAEALDQAVRGLKPAVEPYRDHAWLPPWVVRWVREDYRRILDQRNTFIGCTFEGPPKYQNY